MVSQPKAIATISLACERRGVPVDRRQRTGLAPHTLKAVVVPGGGGRSIVPAHAVYTKSGRSDSSR
jgi:hypothetical protein